MPWFRRPQRVRFECTCGRHASPSQGIETMKFTPYLNFNGHCREAMNLYQQLFGGELTAMMSFGETPAAEHVPKELQGNIMHACLEFGDGQTLMASDTTPQCPYVGVKGMAVAVNIIGTERTERIYKALAEGGKIEMELQQTFWALRFASVIDRFGTPWLINCDKEA
jgi:PhnB protein